MPDCWRVPTYGASPVPVVRYGGIGGLLARTVNTASADTNRLYVTGAGWAGANRLYTWNATAGRYDGITQNYISTYANGGSFYWGLYYDTALFYYRPGTDVNGAWSTVTGTFAHPSAPTVRKRVSPALAYCGSPVGCCGIL